MHLYLLVAEVELDTFKIHIIVGSFQIRFSLVMIYIALTKFFLLVFFSLSTYLLNLVTATRETLNSQDMFYCSIVV